MNWDVWDYLAAAGLIGGGVLALVAARIWLPRGRLRVLAMIAAPVFIAVIWVELAVGIFH